MKYIFLALLLVSCATVNTTFILPEVETYPEERNVLMAVPVIPVIVDYLE